MRAFVPLGNVTEQAAPDNLGTDEEDAWVQSRSELINEEIEHRGVEAVLPSWEAWMSRRGFPLSFSMTEVLTRCGMLSENLMKIERKRTDICHHCGEGSLLDKTFIP